jgi:hypothetical protein
MTILKTSLGTLQKNFKKGIDNPKGLWYNIIKKRVATNANKERKTKMEKMTARNFYTLVHNGTMNDEIKAFAAEAIRKMDEANKKKQETMSPSQKENIVFKQRILDVLEGKDYTIAATIAELVEISPNKASALCRQLVADGALVVTEVKNEKKNKVKAYKLA